MRNLAEELIAQYAASIGSRVVPRDTQQRWTRATKQILTSFAETRGWTSVASGLRNHEFLLDYIAVDSNTFDVKLAVESQWGPLGAVIRDFRKLLYIKSDCKIVICQSGGERLRSNLEQVASSYPRHVVGETYILLDVNEADLCIRSHVWRASEDGPADVRFQPFLETVRFAFVASAAMSRA